MEQNQQEENKNKNLINQLKDLKIFAPLLAVLLVLACVGSSLSGYEAPVYAAEDFVKAVDADTQVSKKEKSTAQEPAEAVEEKDLEKGTFDLKDGVYNGTGTGFAGPIKVAVTIRNKQIQSIKILSTSDDAAFFNRAKEVSDRMIKNQNLNVDTVSGATYSSKGIISAVKNALTGEKDSGKSGKASAGAAKSSGSSKTVGKIKEAKSYKDGIYTGTGTGFGGTMKVKVEIKNGKIKSIKVISHKDGSSYMKKASGLIQKMISGQSTNVNTISGATYSSTGLIKAVRNALSKAAGKQKKTDSKGKDDHKKKPQDGSVPKLGKDYKDGTYTGTAEGFQGDVTVTVVIKDNRIKSVNITKTEDDKQFFDRAKSVINDVLKKQNTKVDTVSGATYSSKGILNAIQDALNKAKKDSGENPDKKPASGDKDDSEDDGGGEKPIPDSGDSKEEESKEESEDTATVYKDGTYTGSATCEADEDDEFDHYVVSLKITVKKDKIVSVTDVEADTDATNRRFLSIAKTKVVNSIVKSGTPGSADTVSGATCSSKAIRKACENALGSAKR